MELKLRINSGQVRDTQVWFGSLAGTTEIKVPLPAYLTGKDSGQINPEEVKAELDKASRFAAGVWCSTRRQRVFRSFDPCSGDHACDRYRSECAWNGQPC